MNKIGLILGILNTVAVAAVLGLFVYTKMIFKRPAITESQERAKLAKHGNKPDRHTNLKKAIIALEPITSNLDPFTGPDGKQKSHFVSMSLSLEIRSDKEITKVEQAKPVIMDKILQNLGKKKFEDLNQVQGRYVFRSQIIDAANEFLAAPVVTEVYFSDFLLQ